MGIARLVIEVRPLFRLDLTVWALRRRPHNTVDAWDGTTYTRTLVAEGTPLLVAVRQEPGGESGPVRLGVELRGRGEAPSETAAAEVRRTIERMLGLGVDLAGFYELAAAEVRLAGLARRFLGVRPPRYANIFEALVNAVACQQLSLTVGIHLLDRLAAVYGPEVALRGATPGFPTAERLAAAEPSHLRRLGFSLAKARTLIELSRRAVSGSLDLEALAQAGDKHATAALVDLPGIGRWSAEYVLLRGLGRLGVFPGDDVGARNSLWRRFELPASAGCDEVAALAEGSVLRWPVARPATAQRNSWPCPPPMRTDGPSRSSSASSCSKQTMARSATSQRSCATSPSSGLASRSSGGGSRRSGQPAGAVTWLPLSQGRCAPPTSSGSDPQRRSWSANWLCPSRDRPTCSWWPSWPRRTRLTPSSARSATRRASLSRSSSGATWSAPSQLVVAERPSTSRSGCGPTSSATTAARAASPLMPSYRPSAATVSPTASTRRSPLRWRTRRRAPTSPCLSTATCEQASGSTSVAVEATSARSRSPSHGAPGRRWWPAPGRRTMTAAGKRARRTWWTTVTRTWPGACVGRYPMASISSGRPRATTSSTSQPARWRPGDGSSSAPRPGSCRYFLSGISTPETSASMAFSISRATVSELADAARLIDTMLANGQLSARIAEVLPLDATPRFTPASWLAR